MRVSRSRRRWLILAGAIGLASLIRRKADMMVVGEASNGRKAVDLWRQHRPDVMLLDLRMPELDGVSAIKEIRGGDEHARIIVLTTFDGDEDIYRAIQAGAKGYLLKDVPREALIASVECTPAKPACRCISRPNSRNASAAKP
jgi:two-component system NarL family response regulator